jgi:hypothetical protein
MMYSAGCTGDPYAQEGKRIYSHPSWKTCRLLPEAIELARPQAAYSEVPKSRHEMFKKDNFEPKRLPLVLLKPNQQNQLNALLKPELKYF